MDALTFDLIATVLTSSAAIAATGFALWVLPWSERDWEPRAAPARKPRKLPGGPEPAARALRASTPL